MRPNDLHALTRAPVSKRGLTMTLVFLVMSSFPFTNYFSNSCFFSFFFFLTSVMSSLSRMSPSLILTFSLIHQYPLLALSVTQFPRKSLKVSPERIFFTTRRNLSSLEHHAVRGGLQQAASERVLTLPWLHLRRRVGHGAGHPGGGP